MRLALVLFVPMLLVACASPDAGITRASLAFPSCDGTNLPKFELVNGKEYGSVAMDAKLPTGAEFHYRASAVSAFDGQRVRAEVEKAVAKELGDLAPSLLPRIMGVLFP